MLNTAGSKVGSWRSLRPRGIMWKSFQPSGMCQDLFFDLPSRFPLDFHQIHCMIGPASCSQGVVSHSHQEIYQRQTRSRKTHLGTYQRAGNPAP